MASHDEHCLCDVVVTEPVEIIPDISKMWGGPQIVRAALKGDRNPLELFQLLLQAHDIWVEQNAEAPSWDTTAIDQVRAELAAGAPINRVLGSCGVTPAQFAHMVQPGCDRVAESLSALDLLAIQRHGRSGGTRKSVERKYGLQKRWVKNCFELMGITRDMAKCSPSDKLTIEQRREVVAMVMSMEHSHSEMVRHCYAKYGVHLDRTYFSKLRSRELERQKDARGERKQRAVAEVSRVATATPLLLAAAQAVGAA